MSKKGQRKSNVEYPNCKLIAVVSVNIAKVLYEVRVPVNEGFRNRWNSSDPETHERAYNYLAVRVKAHLATRDIIVLGRIEGDAMKVMKFVPRSFDRETDVGVPRVITPKKKKGDKAGPGQLSFLPKTESKE